MRDLNGDHQEWLGFTITNCNGDAALDFATVCGCDQLLNSLTQARGGTFDLPMTNVHHLLEVIISKAN